MGKLLQLFFANFVLKKSGFMQWRHQEIRRGGTASPLTLSTSLPALIPLWGMFSIPLHPPPKQASATDTVKLVYRSTLNFQ